MTGTILVTGGAGFIGSALVRRLSGLGAGPVVALDLRPGPDLPGVTWVQGDIRDPAVAGLFIRVRPAVVVHLASVVAAGGDAARDYAIDVEGTANIASAVLACGARRLVVTSSGAAYGYHPDNPVPLTEGCALRGNEDFPYSRHKRLVEENLAELRRAYPGLEQVIFRPCTVLGPGVRNQITAIFERPVVTGLSGNATPFSFVADEDVVAALVRATADGPPGVYNLAGDGTVSLRDIARALGKPFLGLPPAVMRGAIGALRALRLTRLEPAQVAFIQYRPVLDNAALKRDFGFTPRHSSRAAFDRYARGLK